MAYAEIPRSTQYICREKSGVRAKNETIEGGTTYHRRERRMEPLRAALTRPAVQSQRRGRDHDQPSIQLSLDMSSMATERER